MSSYLCGCWGLKVRPAGFQGKDLPLWVVSLALYLLDGGSASQHLLWKAVFVCTCSGLRVLLGVPFPSHKTLLLSFCGLSDVLLSVFLLTSLFIFYCFCLFVHVRAWLHVCMCLCVSMCTHMSRVRGKLMGVGFLFSSCESWEQISGCQAWQQMPSSTVMSF